MKSSWFEFLVFQDWLLIEGEKSLVCSTIYPYLGREQVDLLRTTFFLRMAWGPYQAGEDVIGSHSQSHKQGDVEVETSLMLMTVYKALVISCCTEDVFLLRHVYFYCFFLQFFNISFIYDSFASSFYNSSVFNLFFLFVFPWNPLPFLIHSSLKNKENKNKYKKIALGWNVMWNL